MFIYIVPQKQKKASSINRVKKSPRFIYEGSFSINTGSADSGSCSDSDSCSARSFCSGSDSCSVRSGSSADSDSGSDSDSF